VDRLRRCGWAAIFTRLLRWIFVVTHFELWGGYFAEITRRFTLLA
jgi:hypothetical protein